MRNVQIVTKIIELWITLIITWIKLLNLKTKVTLIRHFKNMTIIHKMTKTRTEIRIIRMFK